MSSVPNTSAVSQIARGKRVQSLDILRGVAILLVLSHHDWRLHLRPSMFSGVDKMIGNFGWTGVDLFFVLSGFLIGGLLFREIAATGKLDTPRFLIRRAFKIWPGYFVLLAFIAIHRTRHGHPLSETFRKYWPNLLHIQNYTSNIRGHTWSLAVEEHFYLLLPLAILFLNRRSARHMQRLFIPLAAITIGAIALFRTYHGIYYPYTAETHYYPTHLRADALIFGVILAHLATFEKPIWDGLLRRRRVLALLGVALLVPVFCLKPDNLFVYTSGYALLYLGYGCLLIAILGVRPQGWVGRVMASPIGKTVSTIGFFSYAIYLWHMDIAVEEVAPRVRGVVTHFNPNIAWILGNSIYVASAVLTAVVLTWLIEKPALALRDRWFPAKRRAVPAAESASPLVAQN